MFTIEDAVGVEFTVWSQEIEKGLSEHTLTFKQEVLKEFQPITVKWQCPLIDAHYYWFPINGITRKLRADMHAGQVSRATISAPVGIYYNASDRNRLTCALSDGLNPIELAMGVREENGMVICQAKFFKEPTKPSKEYTVILRIDMRDIHYAKALNDVAQWWTSNPLYKPAMVPEVAKQPMYSTWYSYHQIMTDVELEEQCKLAKAIGCKAIIVDDGWQTDDNQRGYAYTGDWEVCEKKFPDMAAHVKRVHELGMKYILWYSVPYIGVKSKIWDKFKEKTLYITERNSSATLDPRYADVREYLISIYENALKDWDLDGFKLDFVDRFGLTHLHDIPPYNEDMDFISIDEAVDELMSSVMQRLRAIKPDIMIEFRQKYIGPLMRKYGNIFRVGDCPADYATNREGICDIRLLSGNTVAHSDMIMWYEGDKVESAALQINNILFAVPQISMKLDKLCKEHQEMLSFWTEFFNTHQETLLDGEFIPHHPEMKYPFVEAWDELKHIYGVYADQVVKINSLTKESYMINGKLTEEIVINLGESFSGLCTVRNCMGHIVKRESISLEAGLHRLEVPASGVVQFN